MNQPAKTQAIDESLLFSDSFDEGKLDEIENMLGRFCENADSDHPLCVFIKDRVKDAEPRGAEPPPEAEEAPPVPQEAPPAQGEVPPAPSQGAPETAPGAGLSPATEEAAPTAPTGHGRRKRVVVAVSLALVLFGVAGTAAVSLREPPAPEPARIRRAIVIPHYREALSFLLLSGAGEDRSWVKVGLDVEFSSEEALAGFRADPMPVREALYGFLATGDLPRANFAAWQKAIEGEVRLLRRPGLESARIKAVRLSAVDRL